MEKPMVDFDEDTDDLDSLIDRAVDTFFVEEPDSSELSAVEAEWAAPPEPARTDEPEIPAPKPTPSFEEAVDTLFMSSFREEKQPSDSYSASLTITSGDPETDRAIDLAVDTLFVEEPETPAPETVQLEVAAVEARAADDRSAQFLAADQRAREMKEGAAPPRPEKAARKVAQPSVSYDDAMALEIQRHMHTLYKETRQQDRVGPAADATSRAEAEKPVKLKKPEAFPLRQLQEAILTLEWEISRRSVTALAEEIRRVRTTFQHNVTVDFAALSMRVVLDYVIRRMSRAHPESIRFLLDITDYLGKSLNSSERDPLVAFHHILTRYEKYKSAVRKAEGIPDHRPAILDELSISDPESFSRTVTAQALTLKRAGLSLAEKLRATNDPENLIRSFRFLVNRSLNRILESTVDSKTKKGTKPNVRQPR
jgi:hypothetical protein